jgi:peroxiredoxin
MSWPWIGLVLTQGILLVLLGLIVLGVLCRVGSVLEAVEAKLPPQRSRVMRGPVVGSQIPPFVAVTADGSAVSSDELSDGPAVLLFVSPHCRPCLNLLAEFADRRNVLAGTALVIITPDPEPIADNVIDARVLVDRDRRISQALGVLDTPSAIAVDAHGRVVAPIQHVNTVHQLQSLAASTLGGSVTDIAVSP